MLRRRAAIEGVLGQQGHTHLLNVSADTDQYNTSYVKALLAETHANTYLMEVCEAPNYVNLISLLANTTGWSVDGRQFRLWASLLPPTEAFPAGDACQMPPDDPRTTFNETSFFNSKSHSHCARS